MNKREEREVREAEVRTAREKKIALFRKDLAERMPVEELEKLMTQFEDNEGDYKRKPQWWYYQHYYHTGRINDLFVSYAHGYLYGKSQIQ